MDRGIRIKEIVTSSAEETLSFGRELGTRAKKNSIFCFFGDLGAGKTTLIKGIVEGATGVPASKVSSPTFVYLNTYSSSQMSVYHFDLYRLKNEQEFLRLGFEEYFFLEGIVCIEWSERISSLLPNKHTLIRLHSLGEDLRKITYEENII
jgi:tRNA threonylcarbamoyladenosine biosynthesis protein TsaE